MFFPDVSFQIHCPAVQNKRSSEGTQARCTSAHRVPRQAYLLRRPLPVDRASSGSPVIRPVAAAVLAAVSWTTTGDLQLIPLFLATSCADLGTTAPSPPRLADPSPPRLARLPREADASRPTPAEWLRLGAIDSFPLPTWSVI